MSFSEVVLIVSFLAGGVYLLERGGALGKSLTGKSSQSGGKQSVGKKMSKTKKNKK